MGGERTPLITVRINISFICIYALKKVSHSHFLKCLYYICVQIDPSQSRSALLNIPYLLPCVCVQVLSAPNHFLGCRHYCITLLNQSVFHASTCLVYIDRYTTLIEMPFGIESAHFKIKVSQVSVTDESCYSQIENENIL